MCWTGSQPQARGTAGSLCPQVVSLLSCPHLPHPRRRRAPLPEGTVPVGIALLVAGFATYALLQDRQDSRSAETPSSSRSRRCGSPRSRWHPASSSRSSRSSAARLAHRQALDQGGRPVVDQGRAARRSPSSCWSLLAILAFSPLITSTYFDGNWGWSPRSWSPFVAYAPAHLARGICSGSGRFHAYAVVIGSDGVVRIVACVVLALFGVTPVGSVRRSRSRCRRWSASRASACAASSRTDPGPEAAWDEVTPNLGWLLLGSVFSAACSTPARSRPTLLASDDQQRSGHPVRYGVLLARIPLFLFQAVQAALLPRLARLAAHGRLRRVPRRPASAAHAGRRRSA